MNALLESTSHSFLSIDYLVIAVRTAINAGQSPITTLRKTSTPIAASSIQMRTRDTSLEFLLWRGISAGIVRIDACLTVGGTVEMLAAEEGVKVWSFCVVTGGEVVAGGGTNCLRPGLLDESARGPSAGTWFVLELELFWFDFLEACSRSSFFCALTSVSDCKSVHRVRENIFVVMSWLNSVKSVYTSVWVIGLQQKKSYNTMTKFLPLFPIQPTHTWFTNKWVYNITYINMYHYFH